MWPLTRSPFMTSTPLHHVQRLRLSGDAQLCAVQGTLWVTRDHDPLDHVLGEGACLTLRRGDWVTLEAWQAGVPSAWGLRPTPRRHGLGRRFLAAGLGALAARVRGLAAGLLALARSAEAMASRAQGCISATDSKASAGTV
ncbi:MAG: hypothetical protein C4K60_02235 [Ideonella sp. MAG2]|nr:MAG: hypothetical protein C4K60_02235 [Ideonella sp. MAG2]